nr:probable acyl-[acyl-carrier-protein]--UDP-N-acetylglucosamine O-acyltransferase, mitochondrial isoform X4 [Malus domestica]
MRALVKVGGKRLSSALSSLSSPYIRRFCSSLNSGSVHPSANVHPNAVLGQGVSIGPFCTVGSSAKVGNGCRLYPGSHIFGNTEVGERCVLLTGAIVGDDLPGRTVLGCDNVIGHHAVVGVKCQDLKYKSGDECFLDVGDNNDIREHTSIHRSSKSSDITAIGNNNLIMGSCHIAHDCKIGNNIIFANNTLLAGHVVVEITYDTSYGIFVVIHSVTSCLAFQTPLLHQMIMLTQQGLSSFINSAMLALSHLLVVALWYDSLTFYHLLCNVET